MSTIRFHLQAPYLVQILAWEWSCLYLGFTGTWNLSLGVTQQKDARGSVVGVESEMKEQLWYCWTLIMCRKHHCPTSSTEHLGLGAHSCWQGKQGESCWKHHKSQLLENPARDRPSHSQLQAFYLMHKIPWSASLVWTCWFSSFTWGSCTTCCLVWSQLPERDQRWSLITKVFFRTSFLQDALLIKVIKKDFIAENDEARSTDKLFSQNGSSSQTEYEKFTLIPSSCQDKDCTVIPLGNSCQIFSTPKTTKASTEPNFERHGNSAMQKTSHLPNTVWGLAAMKITS